MSASNGFDAAIEEIYVVLTGFYHVSHLRNDHATVGTYFHIAYSLLSCEHVGGGRSFFCILIRTFRVESRRLLFARSRFCLP